jgi:hypothetical protein
MYLDDQSSVPRAHFHIVQTLRKLKPAAELCIHPPFGVLTAYGPACAGGQPNILNSIGHLW